MWRRPTKCRRGYVPSGGRPILSNVPVAVWSAGTKSPFLSSQGLIFLVRGSNLPIKLKRRMASPNQLAISGIPVHTAKMRPAIQAAVPHLLVTVALAYPLDAGPVRPGAGRWRRKKHGLGGGRGRVGVGHTHGRAIGGRCPATRRECGQRLRVESPCRSNRLKGAHIGRDERAKAMSEYITERDAERAKTARLRALRLSKEAAEKAKPKQGTKTKKRST